MMPWSNFQTLPVPPPLAAVPPPQHFPNPPHAAVPPPPPAVPVTSQTFPVLRPPAPPVTPRDSREGKITRIMEGDAVIVVEGELRNLTGHVDRVEGDIVHIKLALIQSVGVPRGFQDILHGQQTLACRENVLCKYFAPGLEVTVISGSAKGATGMVANVDGRVVSLSLDEDKELLRVFADDVIESSEVTRPEKYELHDLVILDDRSFGVISQADSETFLVLKGVPDDTPEVVFARLGEIEGKIEKRVGAIDHLDDKINVKDVVKVIEGPWKGKQGIIQHIFRGVVFIRDTPPSEHAGIICAKPQSCVLIGRLRRERELDTQFPPGLMHFRSAPPRRGRLKGPDSYAGRDVEVFFGPLKGCKGRLIAKKGTSARVLLEDQRKIIVVDRDDIVRKR